MTLADDSIPGLFGTINPPPGSQYVGTDPVGALGLLIVNGIRLVILAAAILMLVYLLWGGLDWILSGGDKERVAKARQKLTNAVVGMFIVIGALTLFGIITGNILGIIVQTSHGWQFTLPTFPGSDFGSPCKIGRPC